MRGILLSTGLLVVLVTLASSNRLVCYYDRKAATRASIGMMTPANIDPNLCTHIIFSYAAIDTNKKNSLIPVAESDTTLYAELNSLKTINPQLKTLLAVGGPGFDMKRFAAMVAAKNSRSNFISSAIKELQLYGFDGLNLDWRYPAGQAHRPKFTDFCQELRAAFSSLSLLLTASVSAVKTEINAGYNVPLIADALDFINVLTFDFHGPTEAATAHHSPLGPLSTTLTTQYAMNYWKTLGAPAAKLNMGMAAYGVAFQLADPNVCGVGAPTSGDAELGCYGETNGIWSYYETCLYIRDVNQQWIPDQSVPYAVTEGQWVGYDNAASLDAKVAHIKANSYGGACVWALDLDDFTGQFCQAGPNPFINYLKSIL